MLMCRLFRKLHFNKHFCTTLIKDIDSMLTPANPYRECLINQSINQSYLKCTNSSSYRRLLKKQSNPAVKAYSVQCKTAFSILMCKGAGTTNSKPVILPSCRTSNHHSTSQQHPLFVTLSRCHCPSSSRRKKTEEKLLHAIQSIQAKNASTHITSRLYLSVVITCAP